MLVVDDNVDAAVSLAKILRITGHDARTAHSGQGPWRPHSRSIRRWCFSISGFPDINGLEVAKRIAQ